MTTHAAPRIASLLASGTEIVAALGLERGLVAISHECDYPPRVLDRPRVSRPRFDPSTLSSAEIDRAVRDAMLEHGSVYTLDAEALERISPDLILTQAVCEVCAVPTPGVREMVAKLDLDARVVSLDAHTIEEIFGSILQVGREAEVEAEAQRVVHELRARINAVRVAVRGATRPRVLAMEWLDPPFAPGHWVPEMIEIAGGENLVGEAGRHSRQLQWSELTSLDPDVLLIMPCGYGLEQSLQDADRAAHRLHTVAPRALAERRTWAVDGSAYFNRSGPRVVRGIEILAGLLHPDRQPVPPSDVAAPWPAGV